MQNRQNTPAQQHCIGILTLPLLANYGGLLQAAALQECIRKLGGNPVNISYSLPSVLNTWHIQGRAKRILLPIILRLGLFRLLFCLYNCRYFPLWAARILGLRSMICARRGAHQRPFIRQYINQSAYLAYPFNSRALHKLNVNAYVVGSDQVWRYGYVPDKRLFCCGFTSPEIRRNSISYATSFGVDQWEWPKDLTETCRPFAQEFKALSFREESGVELCRKHLGIEALWMPDPTFLLSQNEYRHIINQSKAVPLKKPDAYIAYYILDMTAEKQQALEYLSKKSGLPLVNCMYDLPLNRVNNEAENSYFRPIEHWLDLIDSARYMITDSFHGSVFSIIFNTDFICFGNKNRGNSRFDSLFGKLNLTHCLVSGGTTPSIVKQSENVWKDINSILTQWRERGEKYLKNNLNL